MKKAVKFICGLIFCAICVGLLIIYYPGINQMFRNLTVKKANVTVQSSSITQPLSKQETVQQIIESMSTEQKIGQLLWVRVPSQDADKMIADYNPGGVVMFAVDFEDLNTQQVQEKTQGYQTASVTPMLIATDEEGGDIVRASKNTLLRDTAYLAPSQLFLNGGITEICTDAADKASFLKNLGVNVVLAPVADVSTDENDYIFNRTLGQNADITSDYISNAVSTFNANNIGCCLKHFPGYGNNADTHTGIATDDRTRESFWQNDLLPFKAGIQAGAPCVLVSHNIVNCFDSSVPASLSPAVHELLRSELNFNGVITTDELDMGAIKEFTNGESPAVAAFLAGNDMLMLTNYADAYNSLLAAVQNGTITQQRLNESVERILNWKYDLELI